MDSRHLSSLPAHQRSYCLHHATDLPVARTSTDAPSVAVDAAVQWQVSGSRHPLAFFSQKFEPHETCYRTFRQELLAIYLAIKDLHHFLEGNPFTVFVDHKPLKYALSFSGTGYTPVKFDISLSYQDSPLTSGILAAPSALLTTPSVAPAHSCSSSVLPCMNHSTPWLRPSSLTVNSPPFALQPQPS